MTTGEGAFLSAQEFETAWRSLTPAQRVYADDLLAAAGRWIRDEYRKAKGVEIDDDNPAARMVSIDVVKTAISTGAYQGHLTYGRGEGPRSKSGALANPGGALIFDDWHKVQLGISPRPQPSWRFDRDDYSDARY